MPYAGAATDRTVAAGLITGVASVIGSVLALIGALLTGDNSGGTPDDGSGLAVTVSDRSCIAVVKAYYRSLQSDPNLLAPLTTKGVDGVAPLEADPEARRCAISTDVLEQMR